VHEYIFNTRREFHILTAHQLCNEVGMIFYEDLNLVALSREVCWQRHCLDAAWETVSRYPQVGPHGSVELTDRVDALQVRLDNCGLTLGRKSSVNEYA